MVSVVAVGVAVVSNGRSTGMTAAAGAAIVAVVILASM
jgi:hypothetical protein